ncbi:MAG TPA: FliH/SctL family protein, partial [Myxococcota bacterium]
QAAGKGRDSAAVRVVADATLQRGDCVVDSAAGTVDGRLETRMKTIADAAFAELTADSQVP